MLDEPPVICQNRVKMISRSFLPAILLRLCARVHQLNLPTVEERWDKLHKLTAKSKIDGSKTR